MVWNRFGLVSLGAVTAVLLAACTGGAEPAPSSAGSADGTPSAGATPLGSVDLPQAQSEMPSPVELPFARYFRAGNLLLDGGAGLNLPQRSEWYGNWQGSIAACMKDAGFTYYPVEYEFTHPDPWMQTFYLGDTLPFPWLPDTLEETERVGYGVATTRQLQGENEPQEYQAGPNEEYQESLSEAARREYDLALQGWHDYPPGEIDPNNCVDRASAQFPEPAGPDLSFLTPLYGMLELFSRARPGEPSMGVTIGLDGTVTQSPVPLEMMAPSSGVTPIFFEPEAEALQEEYSQCMLASDSAAALAAFGATERVEPETVFSLARYTAPDGSRFEFPAGRAVSDEDIPEEQRSLLASPPEIALAVDDFKCRQQTDYLNRWIAVTVAAEERYLAEHRQEVQKVEAAIEQLDPSLLVG
ncbi:MAG: hypothetical protein LBC97_13270 [Bifidobacteriaceae bacterium]|jgi:hypothetical protein|nr:hypothetical protein [Bifidobacteriaceae bacterium]